MLTLRRGRKRSRREQYRERERRRKERKRTRDTMKGPNGRRHHRRWERGWAVVENGYELGGLWLPLAAITACSIGFHRLCLSGRQSSNWTDPILDATSSTLTCWSPLHRTWIIQPCSSIELSVALGSWSNWTDRHVWSRSSDKRIIIIKIMFLVQFLLFTILHWKGSSAVTVMNDTKLYPACLMDSDCPKRSNMDLVCFQYFCYPWRETAEESSASRPLDSCRHSKDCVASAGEDEKPECFRHHDRRRITRGFCIDSIDECSYHDECEGIGGKCCNGYCCNEEYFEALMALPCTRDEGCQVKGFLMRMCVWKNNQANKWIWGGEICHQSDIPLTTHCLLKPNKALGQFVE